MESKTCCAYNVTRGSRINSTVTAADSAREPLKVLKVLVEGLARDSKSSLWLTPLEYAPQLTRLFPFDLAYLDKDMKVLVAVALRPEVPAPPFRAEVASALILPFNSLRSSGTEPGDQIIVCAEEELEQRLAEASSAADVEPVVASLATSPAAPMSAPFTALPELQQRPFTSPLPGAQGLSSTIAASVPQGTGFTLGMNSGWRISNSTMSAALLEPVEIADEAAQESEKVGETALAETESSKALEKEVGGARTVEADSLVPFEAVREVETPIGVTQSVEAGIDTVATLPQAVVAKPDAPAKKVDVENVSLRAEEPRIERVPIPAETVQAAAQTLAKAAAPEIRTDIHPVKRKKIADSPPAKVPLPADAGKLTKIVRTEKKKKESLGVLVKRFLNCEDPPPERRSIIRLLVQGLTAYTEEGATKTQHEVRDVSPTGLYLKTKKVWQPGDIVSLLLQRKDAKEEQHEKRVLAKLKVVRCDDGGVGFAWAWPEGVEFEPWKRVHTKRSDETDADYFLRELRLTTALGFLRRICPAAFEEMKMGLHKRLSNKRVASAVDIALGAQELLAKLSPRAKVQAHPDMVRRIIENGSWTEDHAVQQWWAGLLASSCSTDAPDSSNSVFIDLLAKLMPAHLRAMEFVCPRANDRIAAGEPAATVEVYCTSEELIEAVGSPSLSRIQQTMGQLSSLALLADSNKPSYVDVTDKVKTRATPTALGLKMYARCHGLR